MARPRKRKSLVAWLDVHPVGHWEAAADGEQRFHYTREWLRRPDARPVSLALPLRSGAPYRGAPVATWREHLRPDDAGDCFGAVQLLPEGEPPAAPTAHVSTRVATVETIANAWMCSRIAAALGLPVARTEIGRAAGEPVLLVERFDRHLAPDGTRQRLAHESLCQALGVPASRKYEAAGGPGARQAMELLLGSRCAERDRLLFLEALVVAWLLAAANMHARHVAIEIEAQGRFRLAPLHGHVSAWPSVGGDTARMAMAAIGDGPRHGWDEIQPRHWLSTAQACGCDPAAMRRILETLVQSTPRVVSEMEAVFPTGFPESVGAAILRGVERSTRRLEHWLTRS